MTPTRLLPWLALAFFAAPVRSAPPEGVAAHVEAGTAALTPLGFDALLVADHPLAAARAEAAARHGRAARDVGPLDANPTLAVTPGARLRGVDAPGPEWAIAIGQGFALGDQLGARRDALAAEGRVLAVEVDHERLERRLEAAHLWLDSWRLGRTLALLDAEETLADASLALAEDALRRGAGTRADTLQMESWRSEIALRRLEVEGELFDTAVSLAVTLGAAGPSASEGLPRADGPLPSPPVPSEGALASLATRLPAARLAALEAQLAASRVREVEASRDLRLDLTLQADSDSEGNAAVRVGLAAPLPLFDRVDPSLPAARASERVRVAEADAAIRRLGWRMARLEHDLRHWRHVVDEIATRTLPAIERVVELHERRLRAGEGTRLELLDARRRRLGLLTRKMDVEVALARAGIEAWLLWQAAGAAGNDVK